ncbi:thiamine-phosphate kinase [Prevotella corporis]|uniref:Thiamine-monophosphate kinase n=1 Tax=Prevotella corporis TaxID=28128 RepID=A0A133QAJ5_9BACT|nr:thiamine-phosphate kinase [Prevotella corporis]KXA39911.1 thiamine-phosphate kinase [Prevotella corporis]
MEIKELGEFGLIERLTKDINPSNQSTVKGIGDDAAVLHYSDKETLVASHMFMEGIQFDLTYIDMQHLAYKCAMITMSNIFAMNGKPNQLIISIGLGKRFKVEDLDQFYKGLKAACGKWSVDIIGGDTTSSYTGLAINMTCIGEAAKNEIVYRNGAKPTDIICVSGDLGSAYMGLQILEREKTVFYQQVEEYNKKLKAAQEAGNTAAIKSLNAEREVIFNFQPDFAGKEYLIDRQLKPEAPGNILAQLRDSHIHPTAMIDISDGLASDLKHICKDSKCGCRIYEDKIPIDYQTAATCEEFNMNLTTAALNGGEDYELLFTIPISEHAKIEKMENIRQIGYITEQQLGEYIITRDGNEFKLLAQGWQEE